MSALIIRLEDYRVRQPAPQAYGAEADTANDSPIRFHFWSGASGQRYVHTIYSLFDCPAVGGANYILVRRQRGTLPHVLAIGRVSDESPSMNLAEIRQHGAAVGATEVHIHLLAAGSDNCAFVESDLALGTGVTLATVS